MSNAQQDTTLADYLRVLKQRKLFIIVVALICTAAALGVSLIQKKSYDATASEVVKDPNQDLLSLGGGGFSTQTPLQLASAHAPDVTRPEVLAAVKKSLHSPLTLSQLKSAVTVGIDTNSFLVTIDAAARNPNQTAAIANAFAEQDARLTTDEARASFAAQATQLQKKLKRLTSAKDPNRAIYIDRLSTLQSLAAVAQPVQVSQSATVPSSPTSPKPVRNAIAALMFGLLLGVALAYGRAALDRRLRRSSDVEQQLSQPVVGHIRSQALGHAGAAPGSNGSGPLADVDAESFRILRHNVRYLAAGEGIRTLLVTSATAQEGKSTVAASLASASAEAGKRTLLIECDLRRPVLARRFGLAETPGLTEYLVGHASPAEILQVVKLAPSGFNGSTPQSTNGDEPIGPAPLVCITSGTQPPRPADLLASDRFRQFLAEVSEVYDTVIIDSAPLLSVADTLEIVPHVAGILLCVRLRQTTREQARAMRNALDRLPDRAVGIVLTDVKEAEDDYYGYYYGAAKASAGKT